MYVKNKKKKENLKIHFVELTSCIMKNKYFVLDEIQCDFCTKYLTYYVLRTFKLSVTYDATTYLPQSEMEI